MIAALDSSFTTPSPAQASAARAAGVGAWGGYLQTRAGVGLAAPWSRAAFQVVQDAGLRAIAFCSGWDDPVALRQLAAEWGVLLVLDDEDAIRPLTSPDWRPAFLQASGAGFYGAPARQAIAAPCRIAAMYPGGADPGRTWPSSPAPAEPHGWQWQGTHTEFGCSVDRSWLDDWFGGDEMLPDERAALMDVRAMLATGGYAATGLSDAQPDPWNSARLKEIAGYTSSSVEPTWATAMKAELDQIQAELAQGAQLTADQVLTRLQAAVQAALQH